MRAVRARTSPLDPRLLRLAGAARGNLIGTAVFGLGTTGLIVAQASLLARTLADAARGTSLAALRGTMLALLVVLIARAVAGFGSETTALRAAAAVKSRLGTRLTAHALRLGPAWLTGQRPGEIATLATRGLDALDPYFARYLPALLLGVATPLTVLVTVAATDWISGLVVAVTLPLIPVFAALVGAHAGRRASRQWRLLAALGGHFLDAVQGLATLKAFGRAKAQADVIKNVTAAHRTATMAALRVAFLSALVLELAAALATALVAVEVGLRLLAGHIGYQQALFVLLLTPEAYLPLRSLGAQFHASAEGSAAANRVFEILAIPSPELATEPVPGGPAPTSTDLARQPIELRGVSLRYPDRAEPALSEVSVTIGPGEQVVLTGPSGAGKSSLLRLLLRLADPTAGQIQLGHTDLAAISAASWRRQVAWVPQHPYLFAGSIAANIALGRPGASPTAIARAARLAGAEDFIRALPDGLRTEVGERGLTLSAGQRQQIALARAFARDASLVLLDEPTAHLDPVAASQILSVIGTVLAGRTVLLVTHDPLPGLRADRVLTLDHGRLVAVSDGPPEAAVPDAPPEAAVLDGPPEAAVR